MSDKNWVRSNEWWPKKKKPNSPLVSSPFSTNLLCWDLWAWILLLFGLRNQNVSLYIYIYIYVQIIHLLGFFFFLKGFVLLLMDCIVKIINILFISVNIWKSSMCMCGVYYPRWPMGLGTRKSNSVCFTIQSLLMTKIFYHHLLIDIIGDNHHSLAWMTL